MWLERGESRRRIKDEDIWIVRLMGDGTTDDSELIRQVSKQMGSNAILAGLTLAQFVEDYAAFLSEGTKSRVFEV